MYLTINEISKRLAETYAQTTGENILCTLPAPFQDFTEEESDLFDSKDKDLVVMQFSRGGKFKCIGFRGAWYKPITVPARSDLDAVFSSENLRSFDLIEEIGSVSDGQRLAVVNL